MGILSNIYDLELGHFNWPIRNSHPIHPSVVHFPLTFLTTAYLLDTTYGLASHYNVLTRHLPFLSQLAFLSHVAGAVTAIPSMTSGVTEFHALYTRGGLNHADKKLTNPGPSGDDIIDRSVRVGAAHGILNTATWLYSGYAAWSRWGVKGYVPSRAQIWVSAVMVPAIGLSAALGGELVYGKGVGVQRMGNALDEKKQGYKEMGAKVI